MFCPRLDHFTRLNQNGTVGKCGHMITDKGFNSHEELENSDWLKNIKKMMREDQWPDECVRCQQSEKTKGESIRTNSIDRHRLLKKTRSDYLIVGGVLDNICNSACQSCNAGLSTKIGSLSSTQYPRVDNYELFKAFPQERIVELDVNGGEPTASKNYKRILNHLPRNIKIVRMNTNGSKMIKEIEQILQKGIMVIVTMSLDGIGKVHDYARWPIKWSDYQNTVYAYKGLQAKHRLLHLDFWTTVSCLNIADLQNIQKFARDNQTPHDWAFLKKPDVLNVEHKNRFTDSAKSLYPQDVAIGSNNEDELNEFIARQDRLRGIDVRDYFNFFPK